MCPLSDQKGQKETSPIRHKGGKMLGNLKNQKYFKRVITIIVIAFLFFTLGIIILKYSVEGETNMPFELSKIAVISSSEGIDKQATNTKWAFDVYQSNDVFLYIDKNKNYGKTEMIQSVRNLLN